MDTAGQIGPEVRGIRGRDDSMNLCSRRFDPIQYPEDLREIFTYHPPVGNQPQQYEVLRSAALSFATILLSVTQPCADQTAALRKLRECVMTANASIALQGRV